MGIDAQFRCTDANPIVHRTSGGVAGFECRIEVLMAGASGFDFIQVPAPEPWRPKEAWSPDDIRQLLEGLLRGPMDQAATVPPYVQKFRQLVAIVRHRQEFRTEESISLLTGKGSNHVIASR